MAKPITFDGTTEQPLTWAKKPNLRWQLALRRLTRKLARRRAETTETLNRHETYIGL